VATVTASAEPAERRARVTVTNKLTDEIIATQDVSLPPPSA
jgi:hypothetical protein